MPLQELLGNSVIRSDGTEVRTDELTSNDGVIGLYFSAYWCGPCSRFTPRLASVYNDVKESGKFFEVVFVSLDHSEDAFDEYFGLEMPWLAIPFNEKSKNDACADYYQVAGIPTLVLVDSLSGELILKDGKDAIETYGSLGFPFTKKRLQECEAKKLEDISKAFNKMSLLSELAPLATVSDGELEMDIFSVVERCQVLVVAFVKGQACFGSGAVLPYLIKTQKSLGCDKLGVVVVPMEDVSHFDGEALDLLETTPMVKFGEKSLDLLQKFELVFPGMSSPHVLVVSSRGGKEIQVLAENAGKYIYMHGAEAFPWTNEAVLAVESKKEAFREEIKSKQKHLEFLTASDECHITDRNGNEVALEQLQSNSVVGIYFSAHHCGPCRSFTPKLIEIYNLCREAGKSFEIVFVSLDESAAEFEEYRSTMPWCILSYEDKNLKNVLTQHFNVHGIPHLILLDQKGEEITANGTSAVRSYGADGFPFHEARLNECEKESEHQHTEILRQMASFAFLRRLTTVGERRDALDIDTTTRAYQTLAFTFVGEEDVCDVLRKLVTEQKSLETEKLGIIIVPLDDLQRFDADMEIDLDGVSMVEFGEASEEAVSMFEKVVPGVESGTVVVVASENRNIFTILSADAGHDICEHGAQAYPWTAEAVDAKVAEDERFRAEIRLKQQNLEFFTTSSECHILDRNGNNVPLKTLQRNRVLGIYFSAHWCDSCRSFTSELNDMYTLCKEQGKSFEVIFVSYSEESKVKFEEYYKEMPWYALSYDDRCLASCVGDMFNVYGIPTLVLLQGDGKLITEDGITALQHGIDYYPWGETQIERAESDREKREEEKHRNAIEEEKEMHRLQEEAGKIVIRRRIGGLYDVKISLDHTIEFSSFCTVAAPSVVIKDGAKAWYEVTFIKGNLDPDGGSFSQIGWATDQLPISDQFSTEGVGDDEFSFAFDGQRSRKYQERIGSPWGKKIDPNGGNVLGVAIDLDRGELLYGMNGDWMDPMGVAFDGIDKDACYFPALTGQSLNVFVNFGGSQMTFKPPDDSFRKVKDFVYR